MRKTRLNFLSLNDMGEMPEKFRFILILLFVFSLPFDLFYSSVIFLTLTLATLLDLSVNKIKRIPKQVWIFQLIFFLALLGYFNSNHSSVASFLIERQLSIFLFPLILPLAITIDQRKVTWLVSSLVLSCTFAIVYLFGYLFYNVTFNLRMSFFSAIFSGAFFNHQFSKPIGIHAGYLSLYVAFSIICVVKLYNDTPVRLKTVLIFVLTILFSGLFFLASRNTIIATFFVLIFILPMFGIKNKQAYIAVSLAILFICFLAVKNIPYLWERFSNDLISDIKPLKNGSYLNYTSTEPRFERWRGAIELIKKSPVFGYGTGDEVEMLKTQYMDRGLFISYLENFNAHNQYLSYLIKNGLTGLLIFLFAFSYYVRLAILHKNYTYISFLILLIIGFYTENILDSNKGIVFFALFNTLFGYLALSEVKKEIVKQGYDARN